MGSYEPGTQLNRARDYLENERALRQIEQDRKAHQEKLPEEAAHQTPGNVPVLNLGSDRSEDEGGITIE